MLTAADVEQKTFSTALRGYDLDEVDDFLDEVVATLRQLGEKLDTAESAAPGDESVEPQAAEPEPQAAEPGPAPAQVDESAISRALIAAQNAADKLLEDAKSEADKIVEGAKGEADTWTAAREEKRAEAESEIAALAERVAMVREHLSSLADAVAVKLDEMDGVIEEASETVVETSEGDGAEDEHSPGDDASPLLPLTPSDETSDESTDGTSDESSDESSDETSDESSDDLGAMLEGLDNDLGFGDRGEPGRE